MDNKEFDNIIKKKLESLNSNGSDDAWDLFKEKWDSETDLEDVGDELSIEDQDLDAKIKTNMQKLRIPFNSKHWIILKEQLELEALFKKKLFVAKSVELIILAFLVLGILNLWPIQNDIYHIPVDGSPMVASVPVDKETAEKYEAQEEARLADQREVNQKIYKSTKKFVKETLLSSEDNSSNLETKSDNQTIIDNGINSESINQALPLKEVNNNPVQIPFIDTPQRESKKVKSVAPLGNNEDNAPIASLQPNALNEIEIPNRPIGYPDIVLTNKASHLEEKSFVSFAFGPKLNLVNSPFDPIYDFDPYNVSNTNFNITAKVHKQIGNLELYGGLGYTNTSYVPKLHEEIYEPREQQFNVASLENIKFKTVNIPVGVRYNIVDSEQYQLYTSAGVDINVIAESEFEIQDIAIGERSGSSLTGQTSGKKNEKVNTNAKLSQKEFNKGILSGGTLKDNFYATASVGFGLNWKTSSRTGIFIEPRYSHFISSKGIGPNEDKLHNLSIDLGFKYQLD